MLPLLKRFVSNNSSKQFIGAKTRSGKTLGTFYIQVLINTLDSHLKLPAIQPLYSAPIEEYRAMSAPKVVASATRQINAVVVSAGLMQKTVKARVGVQKWNAHIQKKFNRSTNVLVHDPNSSLRIGDIISISSGWRYSKHVHHVVNSIVAPFGDPIEARPAVPTLEERLEIRDRKRVRKEAKRNAERGEVVEGEVEGIVAEGVEGRSEQEEKITA
ncbi:hypothetical protein VTL71DRAFT_11783 [Oculimacula yallundae]|uniref:Ribosomal protein S17 n=1 Tax=Oculimacula yallundae TaxID=86028 RepID=A0ABR4CR76_9HELO